MNFDEYMVFLDKDSTTAAHSCLYLDFDIDKIFSEDYSLPEEKNTEIQKQGRYTLKFITTTNIWITEYTALHMAVVKNKPSVLTALLEKGANPDIECKRRMRDEETVLKKVRRNGKDTWKPADYASQGKTLSHSTARLTALELAEELENDCIDALNSAKSTACAKT